MFAGHLDKGIGLGEPQHLAGVIIAEVDRFGGVGFGFKPVLAGFEDEPGVEFALMLLENFCGFE